MSKARLEKMTSIYALADLVADILTVHIPLGARYKICMHNVMCMCIQRYKAFSKFY